MSRWCSLKDKVQGAAGAGLLIAGPGALVLTLYTRPFPLDTSALLGVCMFWLTVDILGGLLLRSDRKRVRSTGT